MVMNQQDKKALVKLIEAYEQFHFTSYVALIDTDYIMQYISEPLFSILHVSSITDNICGMSVMDIMRLVNRPQAIIEQTQKTLDKVIEYDSVVDHIGISLKRSLDNIVLQYRLTPLHNKKTGNIIAIEAEISRLQLPILLAHPAKLLKSGSSVVTKNDELLTNRQHEVLFLHFHCKSAKEIAEKLSAIHNKNISLHTIGTINKQLYEKFNVYNMEKLLEIAYKLGYNRKIPTSLLDDHSVDPKEL